MVAGLLLVGGCAPSGNSLNAADQPSWTYRSDGSAPPVAMFGYPNTAASFSMECRPAEGAIELMTIDTAIEADRPVQVSVGRSLLRTRERLDPPDVYAISRIAVPLAHPLVRAFASGEGPIVVSAEGERFEVPEGSLPRQMVRDCLRQRFR